MANTTEEIKFMVVGHGFVLTLKVSRHETVDSVKERISAALKKKGIVQTSESLTIRPDGALIYEPLWCYNFFDYEDDFKDVDEIKGFRCYINDKGGKGEYEVEFEDEDEAVDVDVDVDVDEFVDDDEDEDERSSFIGETSPYINDADYDAFR